jgi:NAD(P)H-hydrate epimerase
MSAVSFVSDTGVPVPAVTAAEMREVDRIAIEETGPSLLQMMENAGANLASLAIERLGRGWQEAQVLVLAGQGGNGGGGLCAARHLTNRGLDVFACISDPERLHPATTLQRQILAAAGGREIGAADLDGFRPDLVLDALLGYSLTGAPRGRAAELIAWANGQTAPVLSLDLPSGVDATTGVAPGVAVRAAWTLTLALPKPGIASDLAGELYLADIGIPAPVLRRLAPAYRSPFDARSRVALARHR